MIYYEDDWSKLVDYCRDNGLVPEDMQICIITDANVDSLYGADVIRMWKGKCRSVIIHILESGEENKNLNSLGQIYGVLVKNGFDRNDMIVALGGGIVGDIAGFAAATYMRGLRYIQLPTTLLAQAESGIGGKTAVNYEGYKNLIGAFWQPVFTYENIETLEYLPEDEFSEGMVEIIKHAVISNSDFLEWLENNYEKINSRSYKALREMLKRNCEIKGELVSSDYRESGKRMHLSFGHTIGHAIEAASDNRIHHGRAVAMGMLAAAEISNDRGYLSDRDVKRINNILQLYGLNVEKMIFSKEKILEAMKVDKKRISGKLRFILLKGIGGPYICDDVTDEELEKCFTYILG